MSAAPFLRTARLELWQPQAGDLAGFHAVTLDAEMRRFLGNREPSEMDSAHRLQRNAGSWALHGYGTLLLREAGKPKIIGNCGVFHSWRGFGKGMDDVAEAGWIVHRDHWGKGYAQEAMQAVFDWFDRAHGPRRVACMISEGNAASVAVARRFGFAEYEREATDDGEMLVLYERLPA